MVNFLINPRTKVIFSSFLIIDNVLRLNILIANSHHYYIYFMNNFVLIKKSYIGQ